MSEPPTSPLPVDPGQDPGVDPPPDPDGDQSDGADAWTGTWRNQYGSTVTISDAADGRLDGHFHTAIETSPFFGTDVPLSGVHAGVTASFSSAAHAAEGYVVCYTGKLEKGRLETMWLLVDGERDWWTSVTVNYDSFERIS